MDATQTIGRPPTGRIDVISDAICPWCYIGKRQLERALDILARDKLHFIVAWHPFQLNPEMPAEGVEREKYRIAKFGSLERSRQLDQRVSEAAAAVGLEFHLERLTRTPNTVNAHRVIRLAGQKGVQDGVVESLFQGYFCEGADIGDDTVLAELGQRGGLEREAVAALLASEDAKREVLAGDQMARNAGIQGVPSFALQGHVLFSGAVPAEEMAQAFHRAWDVLKTKAA
ncbi:MAG: DsbA family oxidoreductase [Enhydrobacter sp.]|nr:MAG: DsbA family oxidoreductase [Enhydrobacter sp.]